MNSYWVVNVSAQKITEITKSLKSCYFVFILRSYVDELKWRINSEWAASKNKSGTFYGPRCIWL